MSEPYHSPHFVLTHHFGLKKRWLTPFPFLLFYLNVFPLNGILIVMGFFGSSRKYIGPEEFRKAKASLRARGFNDSEINDSTMVFRGDMEASSDTARGIDAKELKEGISWMRKNKSKHSLEESKINILEEVLGSRL
ncbi:MAG: hypothetical protein BMS9Abin13_545 [Patescibacteria group bacterium]|nr:MAG: hypothetical protein BMS9Abin13_545 [Patescibacteria group bacterium]